MVVLAGVGLSSAIVALRWVDLGSPVLFAAVPLAPIALLASLLLLAVVAMRVERRLLMVGAVLYALAAGVLIFPNAVWPKTTSCSDQRGPSYLSLYSHNVSHESGDPVLAARELSLVQPDVVLLQEADQAFVEALQRSLDEPYPYHVQASSEKTLSLAVLSRTDLTDVVDTTDDHKSRNPSLVVSVEHPAGPVRLMNVHLSAPRSGELVERRQAELAFFASSEFLDLRPDVLVGDFNSSTAHRDFRTAVRSVDGTVVDSCAFGGTWSALGRGPGILGLDHVVIVGADASALSHDQHGYAGSDHRGVSLSLPVDRFSD